MSQKDRNSPNVPDEDRLQELLAEATVDCYDEEEEFWGIWTMLEEELHFPLSASLIGEPVELIGLDGNASSSHRGIAAYVRHKGQTSSVSLADLQITTPDSHSAEWLAAYKYWLQY